MTAPLVSVVIPLRDDAGTIAACLAGVLAQDYSALEVVVADGGSRDGSREIVHAVARRDARVRIVDNPAGSIPAGLNAAIRAAHGDVIARVDARAVLEPTYVSAGVRLLADTGAANVGGAVRSATPGYRGRLLGLVTESRFGMGGAAVRYGHEHAGDVDTVYLGMFPRHVLETVGLYDEQLERSEDEGMNFRLRARGGRVLLSPAMRSRYLNAPSLRRFVRKAFWNGFWKVRVLQKYPQMASVRHLVPPAFALGVMAGVPAALASTAAAVVVTGALGLYGMLAIGAGVATARRHGWRYAPALPACYLTLHLAWGLGFLAGAVRFLPDGVAVDSHPPVLAPVAQERIAA